MAAAPVRARVAHHARSGCEWKSQRGMDENGEDGEGCIETVAYVFRDATEAA
jgi:hypothetical protein